MSKSVQIQAYTTLQFKRKINIHEISQETGVLQSTCFNIIWESKKCSPENENDDLCVMENQALKTNSLKGSLIEEEIRSVLYRLLSQIVHTVTCPIVILPLLIICIPRVTCSKIDVFNLNKLMLAELQVSRNPVKKILAKNIIHRTKAREKPCLKPEQQDAQLPLAFCLQYRYPNWAEVIFTDENYFEIKDLQYRWARAVLPQPSQVYLSQNLNVNFPKRATVMFWRAILDDHAGRIVLPLFILYT